MLRIGGLESQFPLLSWYLWRQSPFRSSLSLFNFCAFKSLVKEPGISSSLQCGLLLSLMARYGNGKITVRKRQSPRTLCLAWWLEVSCGDCAWRESCQAEVGSLPFKHLWGLGNPKCIVTGWKHTDGLPESTPSVMATHSIVQILCLPQTTIR